jgi:hypothetical protein
MELISISEFKRLTRLNDMELLSMLENGEIVFEKGEQGELLINIENLEADALAQRKTPTADNPNEENQYLLEEKISSAILNSMDEIIEDAIVLFDKWSHEKKAS